MWLAGKVEFFNIRKSGCSIPICRPIWYFDPSSLPEYTLINFQAQLEIFYRRTSWKQAPYRPASIVPIVKTFKQLPKYERSKRELNCVSIRQALKLKPQQLPMNIIAWVQPHILHLPQYQKLIKQHHIGRIHLYIPSSQCALQAHARKHLQCQSKLSKLERKHQGTTRQKACLSLISVVPLSNSQRAYHPDNSKLKHKQLKHYQTQNYQKHKLLVPFSLKKYKLTFSSRCMTPASISC